MTVKGQDEQASLDAARRSWSIEQERRRIGHSDITEAAGSFAAGYRGALVVSEARERELEAERDREATNCTLWRHDCEQARNDRAVLVEALKEAEAVLQRLEAIRLWHEGRRAIEEALLTIRSALAGVVEAEPTATQIAEREGIGNDSLRRFTVRKLAEAEPDGRTDA